MPHIMLDLETVSTKPHAAIIAIGAVKFSPTKGVYDKFYTAVKTDPLPAGFHVDTKTLAWWSQQSEEAKKVFTDPDAVEIHAALELFSRWAMLDTTAKEVRMWGNGSAFDNVILANAYDVCEIERPWMFYNDRCYRTVKNIYPNVQFNRVGTFHNAVDDAESQAEHLLKMNVLQQMLYDMDDE